MRAILTAPDTIRRLLFTISLLVALAGLAFLMSVSVAGSALADEASPRPSKASSPTSTPTTNSATLSKITTTLQRRFSQNPSAKFAYLVVLKEQADTSNRIDDWYEKGEFVCSSLIAIANRSQPSVIAVLDSVKNSGNLTSYRSYFIINSLRVVGNYASALTIAALPQVSSVDEFPFIVLDSPERVAPQSIGTPCAECISGAPSSIQWNASLVHAPEAWKLGYDGTGSTVGSIDTGVHYTHEALVGKYRGNLGNGTFNHNYNWWDAARRYVQQTPLPYPFDSFGHGTFTLGIALGANGIGVAPAAKWIAANPVDVSPTDQDHVSSMQFMLCPTDLSGQNPDSSKRPDVVSNSWSSPESTAHRECPMPSDNILRIMVQRWLDAGIFPSWSGGNDGEAGNQYPAAFPETFEIGSLVRSGIRAPSASYGPSCFPYGNRQFPQLMAGGGQKDCYADELILSAGRDANNQYCYGYGASAAQPAIAGAVAILRQVNRNLSVDQIANILRSSANWEPAWETEINPLTNQPCGPRPNYCYGWGLLRIDAAVQLAQQTIPTPTPCIPPDPNYTITEGTAQIVSEPGRTRLDDCPTLDCVWTVALPFSYPLYGQSFATVNIGSNGTLGFGPENIENGEKNACLAAVGMEYHILPFWDGLDGQVPSCDNCGVYITTSNVAPNRVFKIEWISCEPDPSPGDSPPSNQHYAPSDPLVVGCGDPLDGYGLVHFEARLHEGLDGGRERFDVVIDYAQFNGEGATIGVVDDPSQRRTEYLCNNSSPALNDKLLIFRLYPPCAPTPEPTDTRTRTPTRTPTYTPTYTPTPCPATPTSVSGCTVQFTDVPPGSTFYPYVRCMACQGYVIGYACGGDSEPCDCHNWPYFRPNNGVTRGQLSKMVSMTARFTEPPGSQIYEDVPPGSAFYDYINRLSNRNVVEGYPCGNDPAEPCVAPDNRPYFRPNHPATRGQMAKIVTLANTQYGSQWTFQDVPPGSTFHTYVEYLVVRNAVTGYPCEPSGDLGEPCVPPENRNYYRPYNNATRGQTTKAITLTYYQSGGCPFGMDPLLGAPDRPMSGELPGTSTVVPTVTGVSTTGPTPSAPAGTTPTIPATPSTAASPVVTVSATPQTPTAEPSVPPPLPTVPQPLPTGYVPAPSPVPTGAAPAIPKP